MVVPLTTEHKITFISDENTLFSGSAAATLALTHVPPTAGSYLKIDVSGGTSNTGTVSLSGTYGGSPVTETVTFTGARWKITTNQYATLSNPTTSGLADEATKPTVTITACNISGAPISWTSNTPYYGVFKRQGIGAYTAQLVAAGIEAPAIYKVRIYDDLTVTQKTRFVVQGQTGTFEVWGAVDYHFQLGTDLVSYVEFVAVQVAGSSEV